MNRQTYRTEYPEAVYTADQVEIFLRFKNVTPKVFIHPDYVKNKREQADIALVIKMSPEVPQYALSNC